ncbi:MAG: DUF3147 family protein [Actinomycetota bacterium]|nr:DUF3147 family protein [Actinomycetota bacterium]
MSSQAPEPSIRERLAERPSVQAGQIREVKPKDLAVRFAAGALTSVVAGLVTLAFGAKVGGVLLAFPAILAASLTLIEEEDDVAQAREDSHGAVLGGVALIAFAVLATLALTSVAPALALGVAALAWALVAVGGYFALWWRKQPPVQDHRRG